MMKLITKPHVQVIAITWLLAVFSQTSYSEEINAKLRCEGKVYGNNQIYEINDGYIDVRGNSADVRGFVYTQGRFQVIPESTRDDLLVIKMIVDGQIHTGTINRLSGKASFINYKNAQDKNGKALFLGVCSKAQQLF
jgi:hypothetical protein